MRIAARPRCLAQNLCPPRSPHLDGDLDADFEFITSWLNIIKNATDDFVILGTLVRPFVIHGEVGRLTKIVQKGVETTGCPQVSVSTSSANIVFHM